MTTELDLSKVEALCWRALCRHHVSEREMVVAATIIRLSFGIGQPSLRLSRAIEIAQLTGFSKGTSHDLVRRLETARALEVSRDRRIYTFLPPSQSWPWLFLPRFADPAGADEVEAGIIWANMGTAGEWGRVFGGERDFEEALGIERIRTSLIEQHAAASAAAQSFPVKDRAPKPESGTAAGELTRPQGTGPDSCGITLRAPDHVTAADVPPASYYYHVEEPPAVLESRTESSRIENFPLSALKGSEYSKSGTDDPESSKPLRALRAEFSNREPDDRPAPLSWPSWPLDPGAGEKEIIAYLQHVLGWRVMEQWGGRWRTAIRECRPAVLESIAQLRLRILAKGEPNGRGGWLRDQYLRFRRVIGASRQQTTDKP